MFNKINDTLDKSKEVINKCEETVDKIEDNKFLILATITVTSVLCLASYIAGFRDGSRHIFML